MSSNELFLGSEDLNFHKLILGRSGKGRSVLTEQLAKEKGISYEEAEELLTPSKEQIEIRKKAEEAERLKQEQRLLTVKKAYLESSDNDDSEFYVFHDALSEYLNIESVTPEQIEKLFLRLPAKIFGAGIQWGFSDTEVRGEIWGFVESNKAELVELLKE